MRKLILLLTVLLASASLFAQNGNMPTFTYTQVPDGPSPCVGANRANGINQRGDIAGRCQDANGPRSWLLPKGATTPTLIDFSSAPFNPVGGSTTRAIDARGDVVGRYFDSAGVSHGYLLSNGVFTAIDANLPGAVDTDARGVNNAGTIVGFYDVLTNLPNVVGPIPVSHGFIRGSNGTFTAIDFPGATATTVDGINDVGDVVGSYVVITDATTKPPTVAIHAYVLSKGIFTTVDVPFAGATGNQAFGINEQGEIAGAYTTNPVTLATLLKEDPVPAHGYMRSADGSTFTQIDFPDAVSTVCRGGINDHGNITGLFVDSSMSEHGFVISR